MTNKLTNQFDNLISFLPTEYNSGHTKFTGYDVIGIFKGSKLIKTRHVINATEFIKLNKRPKTIKTANNIISRFNKNYIKG